ncbi:MAG: response regulator [Dehalococcoidales bacterium]|jgi:DNA-binding response OmpR family regulator|nr:response regulator [Dehalococcoidales bacterium]
MIEGLLLGRAVENRQRAGRHGMIQDKAKAKPRGRILVIDDERVITQICTRILNAHGFEVDIAHDGDTARNMIDSKDYNLCFCDIRTPKMSGMELYRYLKSRRHPLAGRLIFTTGDVLSEEVKTFLSEVDRPFLLKPFTPEELINAAEKFIK